MRVLAKGVIGVSANVSSPVVYIILSATVPRAEILVRLASRGCFSESSSFIAHCTVVEAIFPAGVLTIFEAGCLCPGSIESGFLTR